MGLWVVKYAEPFFFLPLGHSEKLTHLEVAVKLAEELVEQERAELHRVLEHSAAQARDIETSLSASIVILIATRS